MPETPVDDPLLKPVHAGALLSYATSTLSNRRSRDGQDFIPFIKLNGRDVRYRLSAVLKFIADREAATLRTIRDNAASRITKAKP
jgi:hypothetical protein